MTIADRSRASTAVPESSLARWTAWTFVVTFGMLEFQDLLWSVLPRTDGAFALLLRWSLLLIPPLLMGIGGGLGLLRSGQHALIVICALVLGWYSVTSFRGLWIRPGTLDDWQISTSLWTRYLVPPLILGLGLGLGIGRLSPRAPSLRHSALALGLFAALAGLNTFLLLRGPSESVFPPARPVVLLGTILLALALLISEARDA